MNNNFELSEIREEWDTMESDYQEKITDWEKNKEGDYPEKPGNYDILKQFIESTESYPNYAYFIHEIDWDEYAREQLLEWETIPKHVIPYIDWDKWSRDLQMDYTVIECNGNMYYVSPL